MINGNNNNNNPMEYPSYLNYPYNHGYYPNYVPYYTPQLNQTPCHSMMVTNNTILDPGMSSRNFYSIMSNNHLMQTTPIINPILSAAHNNQLLST